MKAVIILGVLLQLAVYAGIAYIILHFVFKFW